MTIMKIPPYVTNTVGSSAAAGTKSGSTEKTAAAGGGSSDRVQLSQNYVDLANAQKSISGTDEIRTDKVEQVKNQLESGNYQVDSEAIATKMMGEIM